MKWESPLCCGELQGHVKGCACESNVAPSLPIVNANYLKDTLYCLARLFMDAESARSVATTAYDFSKADGNFDYVHSEAECYAPLEGEQACAFRKLSVLLRSLDIIHNITASSAGFDLWRAGNTDSIRCAGVGSGSGAAWKATCRGCPKLCTAYSWVTE